MIFPRHLAVGAALLLSASPASVAAQESWTTNDPVLRAIWSEGMERSRLEPMAQALLDSIGPRLTGSPGQLAAHEWAAAQFRGWGIEARNETYGSWVGWRRGTAHVDLVQPRVRSLEARLLAWSPGTAGAVTGEVVVIPEVADTAAAQRWLGSVRGKFVLAAAEAVTCRPIENWQQWAQPQTLRRLAQDVARADSSWRRRLSQLRVQPSQVEMLLARSGAAGVVTSEWTGGWGTQRVHDALGLPLAVLAVTCEDFGLLHRLASRGQGPVIRVDAHAEFTGAAPAMNTIATIPGRALRSEYVVLSAHFDSWDAASGATDNGTGTLVMMEAARILRAVHPNPKRTIVVGLWGGEEQGLNGSRAFAEDNPGLIQGLQALLNQDTGTGRIDRIS
ncbi:MAG: M20/M25/M40 family metallo-hydrolase, partial [Gemmatimonadetes bacterium]|nr:M20/M25/M40 family metallo-hydrolase [Gemmatimonadota bacterium]